MTTQNTFITGGSNAVVIQTDASAIGGAVAVNVLGTFSATLTIQGTTDNSNFFTIAGYPVLASGLLGGPVTTITAAGQFVIPNYGYSAIRLFPTTFTSGSIQVLADLSVSMPFGVLYANTEGVKPSYFAALANNTPNATPTDIAVLFGAAGVTVRVTRVRLTIAATAAGQIDFSLVKRVGGTQSAVNTAFSTTTGGPFDSADAASAVIAGGLSGVYTGNPASRGTAVGNIMADSVTMPANGTVILDWQFGNRPARCPVLRGITQLVAVAGNGDTLLTNEKFGIAFEWVEE